jgi:hypothetical protein
VGQKYEIVTNNIISFEMEIKIQYKDCDINLKKNDKVYVINAVTISEEGYIVEMSETFISKNRIYSNLIDYLNNTLYLDLEKVYQKLIAKKKFVDKIRNN